MINDFEINKTYTDDFGRVSGIFAVDKPVGKTSHDMVYEYRKKLGTKKVGHAGALDPFASGLLIILAGRATKLSDEFLNLDKEYRAEILLGISTDSGDPEGKLTSVATLEEAKFLRETISEEMVNNALKEFQPSYNQFVPVYSSVKVDGEKLRRLARSFEYFKIKEFSDNAKVVQFFQNDELKKEVNLPQKEVKIYEIELLSLTSKNYEINEEENGIKSCIKIDLPLLKVRVKCSKGTYIRQLAEDIGVKLRTPAMLVNLKRTSVGDISLKN